MTFDLTLLRPGVRLRSEAWDSLGLNWTVGPIHPNHGKPVTSADFESAEWLAQITIWETGETELETVRKVDGRVVNKHYDLDGVTDLDTVVTEFLRLVRDGDLPPGAFVTSL